jgi:hypothetical protein
LAVWPTFQSRTLKTFSSTFAFIASQKFSSSQQAKYWYPAGSPNGGLPKQYRHGALPKRRFDESPVPRTVLG